MGTTIPLSSVREFQVGISGSLLQTSDPEYDQARRVWNGLIDRRPAFIARCANVCDVATAVDFARDFGLPVAVRGGGHNAAGLAVCDDGLVIDLSAMRSVTVDPARGLAVAGGGATWAEVDRATQEHGLATTGGAISATGIGGLTLGGGLGWLMRSYGLACDNLRAADVVLADGRTVRASDKENPDLFWGLRGGGGNFGVVTSFEYALHPVGPVLGGMIAHPIERAREVLEYYRQFCATAPDALTTHVVLMRTPDGIPIIAFLLCYHGSLADGDRAIAPLRAFGPPILDQTGPMPYSVLQSMLDPGFPAGLPVYWRSEFVRELADGAIEAIVARFAAVPSPLSAILIEQMGGEVARVAEDATAFAHRDSAFSIAIVSRWTDSTTQEANVRWTRDLSAELTRFGHGVYVNYLGIGEGEERVRQAYGPKKYERLVTIKNAYDPANFFRFNQNIRPTA